MKACLSQEKCSSSMRLFVINSSFHFGMKVFKYEQMYGLYPSLHEMNYWLYLNAWKLVEESETNFLTKERAFHPTVWYTFWADWIIATNSGSLPLSESPVYSYCSLGLSSPWKTMQHPVVFPYCSKDLISSRRTWRDKAQQQAMHHGTGDRELGAV